MTTYSAVSSDLTSFVSAKSLNLDSPAGRSRRVSSRTPYLDSLISVISIPPYTYKGKHGEEVPKSIENVFIDPTVRVVGEKAFSGCTKLGSIVIPSSVTVIDQNAFYGCTSLTSIVIPESVTTIAAYAFHGCTSLSPVVIPPSVKSIGRNAFYRCTSLESTVIPESVTSIGELAFSECTALQSVTLPSSISTIAWGAFSRCSSLAALSLPDGVTAVDWGAFAECPSLVSVIIPSGVKYIGESAFEGCTSLSMVAIPELLPCVGDRCFGECPLLHGCALKLGTDVFGWLRTRFDFMHTHQVCYKADVTAEKIATCLKNHPDSLKARDSLGMSALHVLLMNESVRPEMVELLLNARPELVMDVGPQGMYPLHYACSIPHVPLSVIKVLSNSYTKDGRLILTVRDENLYLPCDLAIKYDRSDDIILHLFERHPTDASIRMTKEELDRLDSIHERYIEMLSEQSAASIKAFDSLQRHGWVSFAIGARDGSIIARKCIQFIETRPLNIIKELALYRDLTGRSAIENAPRGIKHALQKRLLILDRFEVDKKNLLHKTSNSLIMKAIDRKEDETFRKAFETVVIHESRTDQPRSIGENGFRALLHRFGYKFDEPLFRKTFDRWKSDQDSRISETKFIEFCKNTFNNGPSHEVVLKLMTDAGQFRREIDFRERLNFDSKYVLCVNNHYSYDTHGTTFSDGLQVLSDEGYIDFRKFETAIVMPLTDQNLDSIVRNERPPPHDVRMLAKQLAEAIAHVHSKGIIHSDLKLQHVVRFGDRLRLIDLGAAVEIGSCVGNKFSSGILPPEMIAKLSMHECGCFKNYFKDVKRTDPVGWVKIDPKRVGATTFYAVKTYLLREIDNVDGSSAATENTVTGRGRYTYEPLVERRLPYHLVKASETIDVWSFGVMLFSLLTGASLFDVDRDDDLKSGQAMKELYEWNESQKLTKLKNVSDPLAHRLLRKVLSRKPSDRYQSIEEMLQDDYFSDGYAADSLYDNVDLADDLISRVTINLRDARKDMVALIGNSVSVALTSHLEGIEIKSPTCFVILPYATPPYCGSESIFESDENGMESDCAMAVAYIEYVLETVLSCISSPAQFAAEFMKSPYVDTTQMYLFLVDESTGQSVCFDDVYPLEVDVQCTSVQAFLPLMAVVIRILAATKGVAGIMRLFLPGMPRDEIPSNLWTKVERFVQECAKASTTNIGNWDTELRSLGTFLVDQDAHCTFSDLRRIRDSSSGMSMWVSSEAGHRIEQGTFFDESCNEREEWSAEMEALRSKMKSLAFENHKLVSANGELTEKVEMLSQRAQNVKVAETITDASPGAGDLDQLKKEKQSLLDEIRALSLVNSSLEAAKMSVEESLKMTAEGVRSLQAAIVDHPKDDRDELRRLKRDQKDLVEAIRALALANSKLAWRPRCSG